MVLTCVHVTVKTQFIDEFVNATILNHCETRKEKGNLRFDIIQQDDFPNKFILYEVFESEQAAAFHKTTAHYAKWRDTVQEWMDEPRKGIRYKVIEPSNIDSW